MSRTAPVRTMEWTRKVDNDALGIAQLSVRDRLELIEQIWNSLPEQIVPQDISEWHQAELARRRAIARVSPDWVSLGEMFLVRLRPTHELTRDSMARRRSDILET